VGIKRLERETGRSFCIVLRLRKLGAIPALKCMPSCHGALMSTGSPFHYINIRDQLIGTLCIPPMGVNLLDKFQVVDLRDVNVDNIYYFESSQTTVTASFCTGTRISSHGLLFSVVAP
jgi:hypothetical protein